jgi:hypothetical protein
MALVAAEREMLEMGMPEPSPADVMSWSRATAKEKRQAALTWAAWQSLPDPDWKAKH